MEELEELRKKYIKVLIMSLTIVGCIILIEILMIFKFFFNLFLLFFTIIISISLINIILSKTKLEYNLVYKDLFVKKSLEKIFTELEYDPQKGLDRELIAQTKMMNMGDRYFSNDYIKGKYKDISFEQADVTIEVEHESTDSDGNTTTTYIPIFVGRWMIFDFNKSFKYNFQVCQKGFGSNMVNTLFSKTKYHKINLESVEFNKRFNVYAINDHDVFYVLSPSLIQKIMDLSNQMKGKVLLCFFNNKLHVGLNNNIDSFEATSPLKKIDSEKVMKNISNDIKTITMFVDDLNLDNDLFKKEN